MRGLAIRIAYVAIGLQTAALTFAENWSQFRGPTGDGVVSDVQLPEKWGPNEHVVWKVRIPGVGWSQPIVWDDRIFITLAETDKQTKPNPKFSTPNIGESAPSEVNYRQKVLCLDATNGKILWERTARDGRPSIRTHINNTYASETPATDGERVVAYFGMMGVYCYDFAGNPLWTRDLGAYPTMYDWGSGSSPILHGDKIFIQCDNEEESVLVALDKRTGRDVWRVKRDELTNWSTPYIWKNKYRIELVAAGGAQMRSYDPDSGKIFWTMAGSGRTATTPVGNDDLLYVDSYDRPGGHDGALTAIRPGASGDISLEQGDTSNEYVAWTHTQRSCRVSSPVVCGDCVYFFDQFAGIIHCHDAKTGTEHYRKRIPNSAYGITASSLANAKRVYCVDQRGRTHVIEAGPEFKLTAQNKLAEEMTWASPAVVGNRIMLRTVNHLFLIGEK